VPNCCENLPSANAVVARLNFASVIDSSGTRAAPRGSHLLWSLPTATASLLRKARVTKLGVAHLCPSANPDQFKPCQILVRVCHADDASVDLAGLSFGVFQRTCGARKFSPGRRHSGQPGASFPISTVDGTAQVFESAPPAKTAKTDLADYHLHPRSRGSRAS
jgi:hypothetical protein